MSDPDELEMRWPRVVARFVFWGVIAVVLYILSAGPAARWNWDHPRHSSHFEQFYRPLHWVASRTHLRRPLDEYRRWWFKPISALEYQERMRSQPTPHPTKP